MAYADVLAIAAFWDTLKIASMSLWLDEAQQHERSGGGGIVTASLGESLWRGSVTVAADTFTPLLEMESRLELAARPGRSFVWSPAVGGAQPTDPDGAIVGAASPVLNAVNANMVDVTVTGLPASYRLAFGTFLSWQYGGSPIRRALHRINRNVIASGAGEAAFEVYPPVRPGYILPASVKLYKPEATGVIVPGSIRPVRYVPGHGAGLAFDFIQRIA